MEARANPLGERGPRGAIHVFRRGAAGECVPRGGKHGSNRVEFWAWRDVYERPATAARASPCRVSRGVPCCASDARMTESTALTTAAEPFGFGASPDTWGCPPAALS